MQSKKLRIGTHVEIQNDFQNMFNFYDKKNELTRLGAHRLQGRFLISL